MKTAVLIPCYNEAPTIVAVIQRFALALPDAKIYVFDNDSSDRTASLAAEAGAVVRFVGERGKGSVVRRMFADVEADIYVLVDGDGTYDAGAAPEMVARLLEHGLDMLVGKRVAGDGEAYRAGHEFGNRLLTGFVAAMFGRSASDMLSGYRVFSRRYVKSFPAFSSGFEIETELTVHALALRMPIDEIKVAYGARPEGSVSKLNTFQDGFRILFTIFRLLKTERPLYFFSIGFALCALLSIALSIPVFKTYLETGLVPRLPTALLSAAIVLFGTILLACGIILETVTVGRHELKRALYLSHRGPLAGPPLS
jgi:glycosyltransferase involved in cell wall biosynthesis